MAGLLAPSLYAQTSITFSLTNPGAGTIPTGSVLTLDVRATFDAPLVVAEFMVAASGDATATLTGRSANPAAPVGLSYISQTSQSPFENGLPHDLTATPIKEVLLDLDFDGQPGGSTDGLPTGSDVLIETLDITVSGTGTLTVSITNPLAAHTQGAPNGQLFDTITIDPLAQSVVIQVEPVGPCVCGDIDGSGALVDLTGFATFAVLFATTPTTTVPNCVP